MTDPTLSRGATAFGDAARSNISRGYAPGAAYAPEHSRPRVVTSTKPKVGWSAVVAMAIIACITLPAIALFGSAYYVSNAADSKDTTPTDAIVVLGAAQYNGNPSPVLRARLQHALTLYRAGVSPRIITVGGKQPHDLYTEGGAGRQWLIERGVPSDQVIAIKAGTDTVESLQVVAEVAAKAGWKSITIDSDPAHMGRSLAIANRLGFTARANPTSTGDGSTVTDSYLVRETLGYLAFEVLEQWDVQRVVDA